VEQLQETLVTAEKREGISGFHKTQENLEKVKIEICACNN
jgi:hypothetical protein